MYASDSGTGSMMLWLKDTNVVLTVFKPYITYTPKSTPIQKTNHRNPEF